MNNEETKMSTLERATDSDENRRFWAGAEATSKEVASWPSWRRCEDQRVMCKRIGGNEMNNAVEQLNVRDEIIWCNHLLRELVYIQARMDNGNLSEREILKAKSKVSRVSEFLQAENKKRTGESF